MLPQQLGVTRRRARRSRRVESLPNHQQFITMQRTRRAPLRAPSASPPRPAPPRRGRSTMTSPVSDDAPTPTTFGRRTSTTEFQNSENRFPPPPDCVKHSTQTRSHVALDASKGSVANYCISSSAATTDFSRNTKQYFSLLLHEQYDVGNKRTPNGVKF